MAQFIIQMPNAFHIELVKKISKNIAVHVLKLFDEIKMHVRRKGKTFQLSDFIFANLQSFGKITTFISQFKQTKQNQCRALKWDYDN